MSGQHGTNDPPPEYPPDYALDDIDEPLSPLRSELHLASIQEKKRLWWRNAVINTFFIASWFTFAIVISLYNKWMFSPEHFGFPYPMFATTVQMFFQFGFAAIMRYGWPQAFRPQHSPTRADYGRKAVPTGIMTGLDIGLSNLSLKMISLSFYTMCKSSSLIFVLLFAFLFRLETFSYRLVGVIFLILIGVLLMVATQTHFVLSGLILVLSASAAGGLRWSLTQLLLKNKKMGLDNPAATIFWLSPVMGLTLAIISAVMDSWTTLFKSHFFWWHYRRVENARLVICSWRASLQHGVDIIQRIGVVPMSIAGIAKEVTTITISAWVFGDELTPLNITGVAITVCVCLTMSFASRGAGISLFTYHKYRKSMDSTVPLDAHGNPISTDDNADVLEDEFQSHLASEIIPLASSSANDFVGDDRHARGSADGRLLFSAGLNDEDEDGRNSREQRRQDPVAEDDLMHARHLTHSHLVDGESPGVDTLR
ncbi:hypothetical protein EW146_g2767 [Bondarzewia mesenterica]|uniref:Sugar phosphate transporter domain-containing protein n=1 Tax=Bondarzewia mesenterica TaxID=1095465 RepID=A0A4S4LZM2_9AGAM|nr:hypothetical protein EW146_g2767 [Bondarzewia mesenterica]